MGGKYSGQGTYEGRNFKKGGGKIEIVSKAGDKGIPPGTPGKYTQGKQVEFVGARGDKGVSCCRAKAGSSKAPRD